MDRADLMRATMLYGEFNALDAAERGFDNGGGIVAMEVSAGPPPEPEPGELQMPLSGIRVQTDRIATPPQMLDAIKAAFAQRRQQILAELEGLGLTGVGQ